MFLSVSNMYLSSAEPSLVISQPSSLLAFSVLLSPGDVLLPVHHWGLQVLPAGPQPSPEILLRATPSSQAGGDEELQGQVRPASPGEIRDLLEILGNTLQEQLV